MVEKHALANIYDSTIGDGTRISAFVEIGGATIGSKCKIQAHAFICPGVELQDDVFIGPGAIFTNVINPRAFVSRKHEFRKTLVKKGASIGAGAVILCGVTVGEYAMVGAGAVVTKNVEDMSLVVGNPARHIKFIDKECENVGQK
jgi:UDP-2-acetamido-3-amino-2,3-dideoxy-glucuronate N-acetyltransferase